MATSDWAIPTGKAVTGATYIKDTDDYISATIEDLVDWCNNANGAYNDWTLTGLRTDFLSVSTAQAITSVKTVDTGGAIDFTGGELRIGGTAVTSSATELNLLDGVTATTAELNILDGVTSTTAELNILDGVTATTVELNILDGVTATTVDLNKTSSITSGTYTPTVTGLNNISSITARTCRYARNGNVVLVSGAITGTLSAVDATIFRITLPISSTFTDAYDASGVAYTGAGELAIYSEVASGQLYFTGSTSSTGIKTIRFNCTYTVI